MDSIIFDIDGTLWDSRAEVAIGWNRAIKEHSNLDINIDLAWLKDLFGKPMTEIADTIFPTLSLEEKQELMEHCYKHELDYLKEHPAPLYPHVAQTMAQLVKTYPLFIVSNCQCGYIECCIENTHIDQYITDFACFGDTNQPKDKTIRLVMERNRLSQPVYVGDIQGDADACALAGIPIIHAAYGFGTIENPLYRIHDFADLLTLL